MAAIILAAGGSTRLGVSKQLLTDAQGETLVHRAARHALDAGASPVVVVVGADAERVTDAVHDLSVVVAHNLDWERGVGTSIRTGVAAVEREPGSPDAVLLSTCDMPTVSAAHLRALCNLWEASGLRVASSYGGTRGIPAVISRGEWRDLSTLPDDRGCKSLVMRDATQLVTLDGGTFDLDTPEDVERWRAQAT